MRFSTSTFIGFCLVIVNYYKWPFLQVDPSQQPRTHIAACSLSYPVEREKIERI